jgi:CheY-like chemotaxis protein
MHVLWEKRFRSENGARLVDGDMPLKKLRVLVVDDHQDCAVSLSFLCRLWGFETEFCLDGITALQAAAAFQFDVFLLDVAMPRMDGYTLALQLRGLPGCADAMFIANSGFADAPHRAQALACGFDYYLVKPGEPSELKSLLDNYERSLSDRSLLLAGANYSTSFI